MALPTDTFSTYGQIGIREDLSDMIYDVSPTETPFFTGIGSGAATATNHEWQTDILAAASADNAQLEGDDATTDAAIPTVRLGNFTQIFRKVPRTTGTADAVNTAGRAREMAYQITKRMKEIKRDTESSLLANKAKVAGNATTARVLAGVPAWLATNTSAGATGTDPAGDGSNARGDGTQRAFTEDLLKGVLQSCFTNGGDPDTIMLGPKNKQVMSTFDGGATKFDKAEDQELFAAFDVYHSDFGTLKIVPNRFQRERDGLVLQMDMFKMAWMRSPRNEPLAKTGDSDHRLIIQEGTLESKNERASGIVADLTD